MKEIEIWVKQLTTKNLIFVIFILFVSNNLIHAHSGGTDSSGGHNCNVGSCAGTYHYHNGGYTPSRSASTQTTKITPPITNTSVTYKNYQSLLDTKNTLEKRNQTQGETIKSLRADISTLEEEKAKIKKFRNIFFILLVMLAYPVIEHLFDERSYAKLKKLREGHYVKGNITNVGKKIYHLPNSQYYDMVKIDVSKGERWFKNETEAIEAGWEKAG